MRYQELSLTAQTLYAELADQVQAVELQSALAALPGTFHRRDIKGKPYWYFGYRDFDGRVRSIYVGPDGPRVTRLVERFAAERNVLQAPHADLAVRAGCAPVLPKHFRIVKRLSEYGLFRAGGLLIGTHAFIAYGNLFGVRWMDAAKTMDLDFAHAGRNVSLALPANIHIDAHGALESLEMGLLPITGLKGASGAQYRNPADPELRLDFVTCKGRSDEPVMIPELNLALEPLKFMEFSLENVIQACLLGRNGACTVNLPAPERFAVHKLIVFGERPVAERTKSRKDLLQVASLGAYFLENGMTEAFQVAWNDAWSRGKGWQRRLEEGGQALLKLAPELALLLPSLPSEAATTHRQEIRS